MFLARVRASRNANCAVGGHGFPVLESVTAAQSPRAQTPGEARVPCCRRLPAASGSVNQRRRRRETKTDPDRLASTETNTRIRTFDRSEHLDRVFGHNGNDQHHSISVITTHTRAVAFDFIGNTSLVVPPVAINDGGPFKFLLDIGASKLLHDDSSSPFHATTFQIMFLQTGVRRL